MEDNTNVNQIVDNGQNEQQPQEVIVVQQAASGSADKQTPAQGLFTQEQLNAIIQSRINQMNTKIATLTNQLATAKADATKYQSQVEEYQNKDAAKALGIADEFLEFAIFNAKKTVSAEKPFSVALKEYAEANKQFLRISETQQGATGSATQNVNANVQATVQQPQVVRNLNTNGGQPTQNSVEADVAAFLKARGLKR